MWFVVALAVLAGCGAQLEGGTEVADAGSDASTLRVDAALDAPACTGGDLRATAPDGSCLIMIVAPQSWTDAKATCAKLGAHVAILKTDAMDTAAEALAGKLDTFIGLTDETEEGRFVWVDGTPLGVSNWELGEPNNGGGDFDEDCAIIAGARPARQWDDRPCAPSPEVGGGMYAVLCQR